MAVMGADAGAVRSGEELNVEALAQFLRERLPGAEHGIAIEQFRGGHSNLTYLIRTSGGEYVLRRPPLGPVPAKAHDMSREFAVLDAVHPLFPPAPKPLLLCTDTAIAGAVFFVMERRRGFIVRDAEPWQLRGVPGVRQRISRAIVDCLARLHTIDIEASGVAGLGKPQGFLERQVHGWAERWQRAKTAELPGMDALVHWLTTKLPPSPAATLVHNDFKLDNVMLEESDPGHIAAVLDWEMATVGDPLVDVGLLLCYWLHSPGLQGQAALTTQPGWFTREQILTRYAKKTRRDVSGMRYYEVFAMFKLAVVLQQIYARFHRGQTQDERFRHFDERARSLVEKAAALL